jgi:rubrerythrin
MNMKKMTEENLKSAFAGESQAHLKYLAFADKAQQESLPNVARLFKANSYAEQVHATNHFKTLSGVGKTAENLAAAIGGETFEVEEMYDAFKVVAEHQGEKTALLMFARADAAEKVHAALYKKAKESVDKGKDLEAFPIHVCPVCGFTMENEAPEKCPLCGTARSAFVKF